MRPEAAHGPRSKSYRRRKFAELQGTGAELEEIPAAGSSPLLSVSFADRAIAELGRSALSKSGFVVSQMHTLMLLNLYRSAAALLL